MSGLPLARIGEIIKMAEEIIIDRSDGKRFRVIAPAQLMYDAKEAERNRGMVDKQLFTTFYREVDFWLQHTPLDEPLPDWIPKGELPSINMRAATVKGRLRRPI